MRRYVPTLIAYAAGVLMALAAATDAAQRIEVEIESRAWEAVAHAGLPEVNVEARGRRLTVSGLGATEADRELLRQLHALPLVDRVVRPLSSGDLPLPRPAAGVADGAAPSAHERLAAETPVVSDPPQAATSSSGGASSGAPQRTQARIDEVLAEGPIRFHKNGAELTAEGRERVARIARVLADQPHTRVRITGHTDSRGPAEWNRELSRLRAVAVRDLLATVVDAGRLEAFGRGSSEPVADNGSQRGRELNRRIEFHVMGSEG